jgi:phosphate-selective porin OprO/OprP
MKRVFIKIAGEPTALPEAPAEQTKTMTKNYKWIVAAVLGAQLVAASALADDTADAIAALQKQIDALSAKVQQLQNQHQAEIQSPTTGQTTANTAPPESGSSNAIPQLGFVSVGSNGFWLRSADSNFTMRLQGYGQLDGHFYESPNTGSGSQKDGFTVRRLRAIESGTLFKDYDYFIQEEFGAGNSVNATNNSLLYDAYVNAHYWPGFQIQAGKFKELVNLEWQPADATLWFVERGYPSELVPNRNVGAQVHGDLWHGALSYAAGAFNEVPDGGSGDIETGTNATDMAARIFAQPFTNTSIAALRGLGLGVGTSYGFEAGSSLPSFATLGRQTFFNYANGGSTNFVTAAGDHVRVVPQGWYFWGPAGLFWEYAASSQKFQLNKNASTITKQATFDTTAWDVAASWYLTGEKNTLLVTPAPLHPFHFNGSGLGAWQLTARIGGLDLDKAAFNKKADFAAAGSAQSALTWGVGLNWLLNNNIKVMLDYEQTGFGFAPGYPAAKRSFAAQDEKVLLTRLQFAF